MHAAITAPPTAHCPASKMASLSLKSRILGLLSVNVVHHVDVSDTNESVPLTKADILRDYGDVFEDLGNLRGEYMILNLIRPLNLYSTYRVVFHNQ